MYSSGLNSSFSSSNKHGVFAMFEGLTLSRGFEGPEILTNLIQTLI